MPTADFPDIMGSGVAPIPEYVKALADAAISAKHQPASRRVAGRYLAWLEQEAAAVRRELGYDQPHVMKDGRELVFTPVDGAVISHQRQFPDPLPRAVGVLALIGLLESA